MANLSEKNSKTSGRFQPGQICSEGAVMRDKLTDKQSAFVSEYPIDKCAKKAAIRAGYAPKYADRQGYQLLEIPRIRALIDKKLAELEEKAGLTAEAAMLEVRAIATSNIKDAMEVTPDSDFVFKNPDDIPNDFWKAAQEVTVYQIPNGGGTATKIKMHPKIPALKMEYERLKLIGPDKGVTNNIMMQVNALEYNRAMRRIGEKEGE